MIRFLFPWPRAFRLCAFWLCAAGLIAAAAQAQTPAAAPAPPMDALAYRSALADYQPYQDQPVRPWREANDEVGRIGGWRAYAREAAGGAAPQARPADAPAPASTSVAKPASAPAKAPPAADPHAGHHGSQP